MKAVLAWLSYFNVRNPVLWLPASAIIFANGREIIWQTGSKAIFTIWLKFDHRSVSSHLLNSGAGQREQKYPVPRKSVEIRTNASLSLGTAGVPYS
ncbi:hypothetical protein [Novacetimonas pomaceti]|uniref:hypothetical protein n=1 Tax=Novacetimonas pomaceti TaxID=2021998 RepID=UPI001057C26A|nr:hypothetical protein [Novacetimonas pomaceti]